MNTLRDAVFVSTDEKEAVARRRRAGQARRVSRFAVAAADVVLGASCPGCDRPAIGLCAGCRLALQPRGHRVQVTSVPTWAAADNAGPLRPMLSAYKEHGRTGLLPVLGSLLASAVVLAAREDDDLVLVPVPSSWRSRRRRGSDTLALLAAAACHALERVGVRARTRRLLAQRAGVRDQAALSAAQRSNNLAGAMRRRPGSPAPSGLGPLIVVDDIVTSGASITESTRVLDEAGGRVLGAAVVAATPPPRWMRRLVDPGAA